MTRGGTTHILLADDDGEDQELLKEALHADAPDAEVAIVWNGAEAVSYLSGCSEAALPDVIVLDYKMPVLNGAEVLEHLVGNERYARIPKIVWSSSNQQEYIDRCIRSGAALFVTKPNDMRELKKITDKILSLCGRSL